MTEGSAASMNTSTGSPSGRHTSTCQQRFLAGCSTVVLSLVTFPDVDGAAATFGSLALELVTASSDSSTATSPRALVDEISIEVSTAGILAAVSSLLLPLTAADKRLIGLVVPDMGLLCVFDATSISSVRPSTITVT